MGLNFLKVLLVVLALGVIIVLLRLSHSTKLEKRLSSFAISSIKDEEKGVFDKLGSLIWSLVRKISKVLKKSTTLNKYAQNYEKYINYEEREIKEGIDFISLKFLGSIVVIFLGLITLIIHSQGFNFGLLLLICIIVFFLPDIFWHINFAKRRKRIEEDLLKAIIIMNNAFQSGRNIMQAAGAVKDELDGPIQDEFKKIYLDITYGLSIDVVFNRFYERVKLEDAKYITTCLSLFNKTGGDIVKVFSLMEKNIYERKTLNSEVKSLTSASEFTFKFLVILPIVFVIVIYLISPTFFVPLYTTPIGIIILAIITILYLLYIVVVRKLLKVKI